MSAGPSRRAALAGLAAALATPALAGPARAPVPPARGAKPSGSAAAAAARRAQARGLTGRVGFSLRDLETGETADALAGGEGFAPASTAKAPTALYALEALGPGARFATRVLIDGPVRDGVLEGDLALVGGGDPELDSAALATLAAQVAEAGIARVTGRFLVDAGALPVSDRIDRDQPVDAAYNPAVAGLNLNFNRVRFRWRREGEAVAVGMEAHAVGASPPTFAIDAALESPDCGCPVFAHERGADGEVWRVRRDMLTGEGSVWLPVRAPAAYAGDVFRTLAGEAGVALPAPEPGAAPEGAETAAVARSRTVREIAADMMRFSTNLTAEALGLAASAARGAPAGSLAESGAAMSVWGARRAGFAAGAPGFRFANHSGLTTESRIAPDRMTAFLASAADTALPALMEDRRIGDKGAPAPDGAEVIAKTGTIDFGRALAGYATAPSGRRFAFAIFANDLPRREETRGLGRRPPGARAWSRRAQALERAVLRTWLSDFG